MTRRKLIDNRERIICFICEKIIPPKDSRFMVACDSPYYANLYIHRKCNEPQKIKKALTNDQKASKIIRDSVQW